LHNTGSFAIDFTDDLLSLNSFELEAIDADVAEYKQEADDRSLIYREARIY